MRLIKFVERLTVDPSPPARIGEMEPIHPDTRFEPEDIHAKAVFLTGVGLLVVLWAVVLLTYPLVFAPFARQARFPPPPVQVLPPEPRIQPNPREDLKDTRAYEDRELSTYHWINRAQGTLAIPVDDAIKLVAQRGIAPQPAPAGLKYFDPHVGSRETGFAGKVEPR